MKSLRWMISYVLVAAIGIGLAFMVSTRFMTPARSQSAPSNGDLPAEFMKDMENTSPPVTVAPSATPSSMPVVPPAAIESGVVPPPPETGTELPLAEEMPAPGSVLSPATQAVQGYTYDPTGKRDPFRAFRAVRPVIEQATLVLEPLQRFDLNKLEVVGILWDVGTPRAMIKDPEGTVHPVTKNTKIGRAEGFVATIREGEIVVVETRYEDGKSFKEPRVMELKK